MPNEKRRHPRLECAGTADVYLSVNALPCTAKVIDLSVEGGLIVLHTPQKVSCGATLELAFTVKHLPFRMRAEIVAIRSETTLGLHFDLLSQRVRRNLEDLIEELKEDCLKQQSAGMPAADHKVPKGANEVPKGVNEVPKSVSGEHTTASQEDGKPRYLRYLITESKPR